MSHSMQLSRLELGEMIDSTGFNQAWAEHHGFLLDVAYRLLGSNSDADDLVQEVRNRRSVTRF